MTLSGPWLVAIDQVGYDAAAAKEVLPEVTKEISKNGASGYIELNEFGDRAFADYNYVMLDSDFEWVIPGFFDGLTRTITWETPVY
jgi:hypothetical protein